MKMICKKCGQVFSPETYREKMTGTCNQDECYTPFSDTDNRKYYLKDTYKYQFKCLRCNDMIYTSDVSERLCSVCRSKNKTTSLRHHI